MIQILLVEDDPLVCKTMQAELEDYCGAKVICSGTGATAVELMKIRRLDAAVIEALLPDMSGFELAQQAACRHIPVLMTTGHPDLLLVCQSYSYPYLEKPFQPSTLAEGTLRLIQAAEENLALVRASSMRHREHGGDWRKIIGEARGLVQESTARREHSSEISL